MSDAPPPDDRERPGGSDDGPGAPDETQLAGLRQLLPGLAAGLLVAVFIAVLAVGLIAQKTDDSIADALALGDPYPAPEFSLPILVNGSAIERRDGEPLALADLRGRPVVLNFWASWCDPCKREAARFEAAWRRHRGRGVVILGLDVQDLTGKALAFVRQYGQTYPSVRDKDDGTYRDYGLTGIPETFFIDAQGAIRAKVIGEISDVQLAKGIAMITTTDITRVPGE